MPLKTTIFSDDYDIAAGAYVVDTWDIAGGLLDIAVIVGYGEKLPAFVAGEYEFSVETGGFYHQPWPQKMYYSGVAPAVFRARFYHFGYNLKLRVKSPNAADIDVTVDVHITELYTGMPSAAPNASGGLLTRGTGAGQINPDGTGQVPSSNAALATVCTEARLGRLDAAVSTAVAAAAAALTDYDPPTNAEMELRTLAAAAYATAAGQDEIKTAVDSVGNSEDTILNSESQVYNTDTADGSTVVNEES